MKVLEYPIPASLHGDKLEQELKAALGLGKPERRDPLNPTAVYHGLGVSVRADQVDGKQVETLLIHAEDDADVKVIARTVKAHRAK